MKKKNFIPWLFLVTMFLFGFSAFGQRNSKPITSKAVFFRVSPPLTELIEKSKLNPPEKRENREVKNELEFHPRNTGEPGPDPLSTQQRNSVALQSLQELADFDGVHSLDGVAPPDTQGDVSPNYYMQCVNSHTAIYDKNGNTVKAPFPTSDFWIGTAYHNRNDGDAVILWDESAQRWLVTQFYTPSAGNKYLLIAVSQTSDPTGSYYQYAFSYTYMPDYPKWGIWPDAYYVGANAFQNRVYKGAYVSAFERDKLLAGNANARVVTFGPNINLHSIFPADTDVFPPVGTPCPFVFDKASYTSQNNKAYIYDFHVDWNNTNNSTFTHKNTLTVANYGLFSRDRAQVPQKGVSQRLDLLHSRIMYRPYYRHFAGHESLVVTRTVKDGNVAAIRWYEFRKSGSNWYVYQQGTYNPGDGLWRWMPSIAMNADGDIALGYSVSSSNKYPSIRGVARHAGDPLGTMTSAEKEFFTGAHSQSNISRWGDYSMVSIDPSDNKTFWFTTEYTGSWSWRTRITHFKLPASAGSAPVANFSANDVTPTVGQVVTFTDSSTNTPTSWSWSFNPNTVTYVNGTSATSQNPKVKFNATGNYKVTLTASNTHGSNTKVKNNYVNVTAGGVSYCASKGRTVTDEYIQKVHLNTINKTSGSGNGYSDFTSISTDLSKGSQYTITVTPKWTNSTYSEGYAVWIDYNHDGDFTDSGERVWSKAASTTTPVSGSFTVPSGATNGATRMRVSMKYSGVPTPCETFNYGEVEDYTINIVAGGGGTPAPVSYCASKGRTVTDEYIQKVHLNTINKTSGSGNGYSDFTSISTSLSKGGQYTITVTPKWTNSTYIEGYAVWIDYNHDGDFTDSGERVWRKAASTTTPVSGSFTVPNSATNGATRMRVSMKYRGIPTPCETFNYGEVEDYTINIGGNGHNAASAVGNAAEIKLYPNPASDILNVELGNQSMNTYTITNYMGQVIVSRKLTSSTIDISRLKAGVYIIRFSSDANSVSKRFVKK